MVRERIAAAARRGGRDPAAVTVVAVTKTLPVADVLAAAAAGQTEFGENRVQEAQVKVAALPGATWHLVGRLQTNKARDAAGLFGLIHSLDRFELAVALDRAGRALGRPCRALIQVNSAANPGQGGVAPAALDDFVEKMTGLTYLHICGLMAIGPHPAGADEVREAFRRTRAAFERLAPRMGERFGILSLGMSEDFETAVEEGSSMVRIGTALFGPRERP